MRNILRLCSISADYSAIANVKKYPPLLGGRIGFAHQTPHLLVGDRHFESPGFVSIGGGNPSSVVSLVPCIRRVTDSNPTPATT